ncbi:MAG: sigma-70 family RNA polymerase sigma factor [Lachnospiraceae bacterium]|nr:sigma-70 family RNA polymerase sigma factor [Lachnospiraceae bacterium]
MKSDAKELFSENIKFAYWVLNRYYPGYVNNEEAKQICLIGLWRACQAYDTSKGGKITTIACICIQNQMRLFFRGVKKNNRFQYVDSEIYTDEGKVINIFDIIPDEKADVVSESFCLREMLSVLDQREQRIVLMRLQGISQVEISKKLNLSQAQIARIITKIKIKIKKG